MELWEKVLEKLEDKITDLFIEIQDEYNITCGDCEPTDEFELTKSEEELADVITEIIRKQMR